MFEEVFVRYHVRSDRRITIRSVVSAGLIALAVILPQIVHIALGQPGGITWLPMYLPVLLGGCLLGAKWAFGVGILSPIVSFLFTSTVLKQPMPPAARLPFMMAELAVFAVVSGLFSGKIAQKPIWALPAVLTAQIAGRGTFLLLALIFQSVSPIRVAVVWQNILGGFAGLVSQWILVPVLMFLFQKAFLNDHE